MLIQFWKFSMDYFSLILRKSITHRFISMKCGKFELKSFLGGNQNGYLKLSYIAWKVSKYGVIPVFSPNTGKLKPEITLFT